MIPLLNDRLVEAHLADMHAEAARARLIRTLRPTRFRWRRRGARDTPPAPVLALEVERRSHAGGVDAAVPQQVA